MSSTYYFPLLFLIPGFTESEIESPPFRVVKRRWNTSTFDLATLATKHKLHLPYQVMDVLLYKCNLELCLMNQPSLEEANEGFQALRLALYAGGLSPFLSPFVTTHSINEYSGVNSRDSDYLRDELDPKLMEGLKSDVDILEAWPVELSFQCILLEESLTLSEKVFSEATENASRWGRLVRERPLLKVVNDAVNSAPKLLSLDQSLLHLWSAIEALFPSVSTELSFRIALYLAQLIDPPTGRQSCFERVRDAYSLRSKVTHGSRQNISLAEWQNTWSLLMDAVKAIIRRQSLPSEQELVSELLS